MSLDNTYTFSLTLQSKWYIGMIFCLYSQTAEVEQMAQDLIKHGLFLELNLGHLSSLDNLVCTGLSTF